MADIPTTEPTSLRAGDTWRWLRTLDDYPATDWTLKYRFRHPTLAGFEIVASASGSDHSVTVSAATSAGYGAGTWAWVAWVEGGSSEKYTVDQGTVEIAADFRAAAASATLDTRSHARKVLAAIEAVIENRATLDQEEYTIAGRSLKRTPAGELLKLRLRYLNEVRNEQAAERLANGLGTGRIIGARL
jgi:hypothetical protein